MLRTTVCLAALAFLTVGCAKEQPKPPPGGVEVNAPGVKINIDPSGKTEVKTPGGDIKVDPNK